MNQYKPEGMLITDPRNYEMTKSYDGLKYAMERQIILESSVTMCDHQFNLFVDLGQGIKGIVPRDEVVYSSSGPVKDIAILTRVGKTISFKIIGFSSNENGKKIAILSRRSAQKECIDNYISTLEPGDIIPSRITHIENFGAFVDIGCGITSLLSIDAISISRISHPSFRINVGDFIYTVVKGRDTLDRIFVSERELLGTWEENAALFKVGETVTGIIRSVESYGIFVELKPNLAGLAEYREDVRPGQCAAVYIKSIIPEKMKIKLIIIDTNDCNIKSEPLEYFIDVNSVKHIDSWRYSPKNCNRIIETLF